MADTTCPVAATGRGVEALWAAFLANDRRVVKMKDGQEHDRLARENEHLVDRRDALEELAAHTRATSPTGAMFQILLARAATEAIASYREEKWAKEVDRYCRQVEGCLYSVLQLLEELSGTPAEEVGARHYMSRGFDPHSMLTAALTRQPTPPAEDGVFYSRLSQPRSGVAHASSQRDLVVRRRQAAAHLLHCTTPLQTSPMDGGWSRGSSRRARGRAGAHEAGGNRFPDYR